MKRTIASFALSLAGLSCAVAQTVPISPTLFGVNYWYYDYAGGYDAFNVKKTQLQANGINLVRLGGLLPQSKVALTSIPYFDLAVDRVKSIGAIPLLQLPINLAPADIPVWIAHFKDKGITYWSIGNEPEPTSNIYAWYTGTAATPGGPVVRNFGNTYAEFRDKFVNIARAIKQADPNAVVIGPDFHQFYGTKQATDPLMSYYPAFIADVGALTEGGAPLLDVFTLHYYGFNAEQESEKRFNVLQSYIDSVNAQRTRPLRLAVGEVNAWTSTNTAINPLLIFPWDFEAGQFLASVFKIVAAKQGAFVAPWSIAESSENRGSTDFSTFNANGTPRSTMVHLSLLATYRHATLMEGSMSGADINSVVYLGMTDGGGSTVTLMNTTTTDRTYSVRLDGRYSDAAANTRLSFTSANLNPVEWVGTLPAKTTLLFSVDANGKRLAKVEYNKAIADAARTNTASVPLVSDLTVSGTVTGSSGPVQLAAVLPQGVARTQVDFYVDGKFVGSSTQPPFALQVDSTTLANGEHRLQVAAYDADGNVDRSDALPFTVANATDVSAQVVTSSTALVLNRTTQAFNGYITIVNRGAAALAGPLQLQLADLPAGVTLVNASGTHAGQPYVTLAAGLAPGASVTVPLSFADPSHVAVHYVPLVYSGNF